MERIGIMVPTKGRPELYHRMADSYYNNYSGNFEGPDYSDVIPVVDIFEYRKYGLEDNNYTIKTPSTYGLVKKLNFTAECMQDEFEYLQFAADDLIIKTKDFDRIIVEEFQTHPEVKIIYCEDEMHHDAIANHWVIRSSVVKEWGYFVPPVFRHLFIDNLITQLGRETGTFKYLPNVTIEHRHFANRKAENDATYAIGNSSDTFQADQRAFNEFIASEEYQRIKQILLK